MTKDFKNKQKSSAPINDVVSWILAGVALGLFVGLMVYIFYSDKQTANAESTVAQVNSPTSSDAPATAKSTDDSNISSQSTDIEAPKSSTTNAEQMEKLEQIIEKNLANAENDTRPSFDYHLILPSLDVEVPVARATDWKKEKSSSKKDKASEKTKKAKADAKKVTRAGSYILQVGAYKREAEAGNMKQKMASMGINAYLQKAEVKGVTWYRVRIGPVSDVGKVNQLRTQLASKGIKPYVKRVKATAP